MDSELTAAEARKQAIRMAADHLRKWVKEPWGGGFTAAERDTADAETLRVAAEIRALDTLRARLDAAEAALAVAQAERAEAVAAPKWGEATVVVDFADLCPGYDPGPAATVEYVMPQIRPASFGFVPTPVRMTYHIAAAQRPDGAPLRGWGRPTGPRSSEFFVWRGALDRQPALHIRNAPPSYTPIHALVAVMERLDREAADAADAEEEA